MCRLLQVGFLLLCALGTASAAQRQDVSRDPWGIEKAAGKAMQRRSPIIQALKKMPQLKGLWRRGVGVRERYTLQQHTTMVMTEFDRYFHSVELPTAIDRAFFRLVLALHDIGKPNAVRAGDKERQHEFTVDVIEKIAPEIPQLAERKRIALAIIDGDPLGALLQDKISPSAAAKEVRAMAARAGMPVKDFFRVLTIFFQTDCASYTLEAGGRNSPLDTAFRHDYGNKILSFDAVKGRLRFSNTNEHRYARLERALGL